VTGIEPSSREKLRLQLSSSFSNCGDTAEMDNKRVYRGHGCVRAWVKLHRTGHLTSVAIFYSFG